MQKYPSTAKILRGAAITRGPNDNLLKTLLMYIHTYIRYICSTTVSTQPRRSTSRQQATKNWGNPAQGCYWKFCHPQPKLCVKDLWALLIDPNLGIQLCREYLGIGPYVFTTKSPLTASCFWSFPLLFLCSTVPCLLPNFSAKMESVEPGGSTWNITTSRVPVDHQWQCHTANLEGKIQRTVAEILRQTELFRYLDDHVFHELLHELHTLKLRRGRLRIIIL